MFGVFLSEHGGSKLCYLKLLWENGGGMGEKGKNLPLYSEFGTILTTSPFIPEVILTIPLLYFF